MKNKFEISDYNDLKNFFSFMWEWEYNQLGFKISEEANPMNALEKAEKKSKAYAFKGLIMAIHDILEMTIDLSLDKIKELDNLLKQRGAFTLSYVRSVIKNEIAKILKQKKIINDTEFYLVNEKLVDVSSNEFTEEERVILNKLVEDYELSKQKGGAK